MLFFVLIALTIYMVPIFIVELASDALHGKPQNPKDVVAMKVMGVIWIAFIIYSLK